MLLQATVAALAYSSSGPRLAVLQHSVAQVPRCEALFMQDDGNTLKCDVRALPQSAIALDITVPAKVDSTRLLVLLSVRIGLRIASCKA